MRVIAGEAGGRRLRAPAGRGTRPTPDRVREALFSSLAPVVPRARVLDLYAGSGALAIEALSRGAEHAVLVERDARAAAVAQRNLEATGLADRATVLRRDAATFCADPHRHGPFDLVLVDAPYGEPLPSLYAQLGRLAAAGGLTGGTVVIVERDRRDPDLDTAPPPPGLAPVERRSYGDTVLLRLHARQELS